MKMKAKDGNLYVEVTLRDVFERCDVSDSPILSEIKRVYDENTRLRESLEESEHSESMSWDRVRKIEADNAKLRELVHDMWCDGMCDCDELVAPRGQYHCTECEYGYLERMRDLGIEVNS